MAERLYRTEGIILKRVDVGEADRLVTVLAPAGKFLATARGVRTTTSKLAGHLELLSHCQLQLARGRSRDVITQSMAVERFEAFQSNLVAMAAGYYVAEMTDALVADEEVAATTYHDLLATLRALLHATAVEMVVHWYTLRLCDAAGYRPQLVECVACGQTLTTAAERWSVSQGGMLCDNCRRVDAQARMVDLATFKVLRFVQREPLTQVLHVRQSPEVHAQVFTLMRQWVMRISERPLRSAAFFDDVRAYDS